MKLLDFIKRFFSKQQNTQATRQVSPQPHYTTPPQPDSGERSRHSYAFQSVSPESVISDNTETWRRSGNLLEGDTVEVLVISASSQIVPASELKSICSICNKAEDTVIRSDVSQCTLCRTCLRKFEAPDGKEFTVSPDEFEELTHDYNTWEYFDRVRPNKINHDA